MKYKILFMVFFVFVVLLMTACSTAGVSQWEYFSPEKTKCYPRKEIKICRQYGPHLICQCAAY